MFCQFQRICELLFFWNYASNIRPESSKASNLGGTLSTDRDRYNIVTVSKLIHYTHSVVFLNIIEFYDYIYFTIA